MDYLITYPKLENSKIDVNFEALNPINKTINDSNQKTMINLKILYEKLEKSRNNVEK